MKPQGNRVGIWTGRNARPQRTIDRKEYFNSLPHIVLPAQVDLNQAQISKQFPRKIREGGVGHLKKTARSGTEAAKQNKK